MKNNNINPVNDYITPEQQRALAETGIEVVIDDLRGTEPIRLTLPIVKTEPPAFTVDDNNNLVFNLSLALTRKLLKIFKSFNPELKDSDLESIFWLIFQQLLIESDGDLRDHETFKEAAGLLELFLTEKKYQRMFIERIYTVVGF